MRSFLNLSIERKREIEKFAAAAGGGVQPGAGFFALVQALKLPGSESAKPIDVKPQAFQRD